MILMVNWTYTGRPLEVDTGSVEELEATIAASKIFSGNLTDMSAVGERAYVVVPVVVVRLFFGKTGGSITSLKVNQKSDRGLERAIEN